MGFEIGQATASDAAELVELRLGYLEADFGELSDEQREDLRQELPAYLAHNLGRNLFVFVARSQDDGCIAACAWLLLVDKPPSPRFPHGRTGVLFNVLTKPAYRRRGLARQVMGRLIEDARSRALDVLELNATDEGYPLYQALGFEDDSSTHVPMRLML